RYESTSSYDRKKTAAIARFSDEHKRWIVDFYCVNPNIFLDKCKKAFEVHFKTYISVSTIWRVIHAHGFTWKVFERRAMQVRQKDVQRFFDELA
ncbi:hypothetical protein H310_15380, partial [Aphanomyces invadans]